MFSKKLPKIIILKKKNICPHYNTKLNLINNLINLKNIKQWEKNFTRFFIKLEISKNKFSKNIVSAWWDWTEFAVVNLVADGVLDVTGLNTSVLGDLVKIHFKERDIHRETYGMVISLKTKQKVLIMVLGGISSILPGNIVFNLKTPISIGFNFTILV